MLLLTEFHTRFSICFVAARPPPGLPAALFFFLCWEQNMGSQIGGKGPHEDVWLLDCRYRTAVVHQKESWTAVTTKLREVFTKVCFCVCVCRTPVLCRTPV